MKQFPAMIRQYIRQTDIWLWAFCLLASSIGVILLYGTLQTGYQNLLSISMRNIVVQCGAVGLGVIGAIILSKIDYQMLKRTWMLHVPIAYLLVLLTFLIGIGAAERPDDKRWLVVPIVNVWLQPAELLKLSFILVFAYHITKCEGELNRLSNIALLGLHAVVPVLLIHFQGDDGTALLIATIALTMLVMAGLSWKYLLTGAAGIAVAGPLLWKYVVNDFQKQRVLVLINQSTADPLGTYYQQYQAKLAIAAGGRTGVGLLNTNHIYMPEMHTDFIFSFLCESFGFMGALGMLALMVTMCLKILYNGARSQDQYGSLLCAGVFAMIMFQFVINVGMCLSLLPVIGNTFPFLSYGGTSVLTNFLGIGLVLSVYMHQSKGIF